MRLHPSIGPKVTSLETIYRQYFDFIWASARRMGVSAASADDIVQEVFLVINARLHTLERPDAMRSWIYGIVRRTVLSYHRSQRVREAAGTPLSVQSQVAVPTPIDLAERKDQIGLLWTLLQELDEAKREIFAMVELDELTVPEVAEILGIPLNTAYSRLRAARRAFEEALARHESKQTRGGACPS